MSMDMMGDQPQAQGGGRRGGRAGFKQLLAALQSNPDMARQLAQQLMGGLGQGQGMRGQGMDPNMGGSGKRRNMMGQGRNPNLANMAGMLGQQGGARLLRRLAQFQGGEVAGLGGQGRGRRRARGQGGMGAAEGGAAETPEQAKARLANRASRLEQLLAMTYEQMKMVDANQKSEALTATDPFADLTPSGGQAESAPKATDKKKDEGEQKKG
jgi:hypothetical protein